MSIRLDSVLTRRLCERVSAALKSAEVENGCFLAFEFFKSLRLESEFGSKGTGDHSKPGDRLKEIEELLGEDPVSTFMYHTLWQRVRSLPYASDPPSRKLTEFEGYTSLDDVAEEMVADLAGLPHNYSFSIALPGDATPSISVSPFRVDDRVQVLKPDEAFASEYPLPEDAQDEGKPVGLLSGLGNKLRWQSNRLYIQVLVDGFAGAYGNGFYTAARAVDVIKEITGAGVVLGLWELKDEPRARPEFFSVSPRPARFVVHRRIADCWVYQRQIELDSATNEMLRKLNFRPRQDGSEKQADAFLMLLRRIFSRGNGADRIRLALHWYLDCLHESDELMKFFRMVVVIEILMGKSDPSDKTKQRGQENEAPPPVTELLSSRCAYSLGESIEEREALMRDFKRIYNLRSRIVHSGRRRIEPKDRSLIRRLNEICFRILMHEMSLMAHRPAATTL
jgi:Apea-like HEPN